MIHSVLAAFMPPVMAISVFFTGALVSGPQKDEIIHACGWFL
jgi:hypothetical protein